MTKKVLFIVVFVWVNNVFSQIANFSGEVIDASNSQGIPLAKVIVKGKNSGVVTDVDGKFKLELDFSNNTSEYTLLVRAESYTEQEVIVNKSSTSIKISMKPIDRALNEIVVTSSRVSERIFESPVSIQKLSAKEILSTSSGNFYDGFKNLKGVDISTSSAGFQAVNMRGFNSTAPVRVVQFVDGMDNQAPGLNFPVGNLVGANPLDLQSV
ncbi:MAG: carboxypeptidase-like regulatory domain-containing protein, partial [Crocinitomicaceae bacterium]